MSDLTSRLREQLKFDKSLSMKNDTYGLGYFEGELAQHRRLAPLHDKLLALVEAAERCQNLIVEDTCEECETFKEVRYSIKPLKDALQALRAEVGDG